MVEKSQNRLNWQGKTFLIVEDDDSSSYLLTEILSDTGATILTAETSAKALKIVKKTSIDLILLDIQLPDLDGYQTCIEIRKKHQNIAIIAQTAYGFLDDRIKALKSGCDDYISKPLDPAVLLEKMQTLLKDSKV